MRLPLDYHFGDSEHPVHDCYFGSTVLHHPALDLTVRREYFAGGIHAGPHCHIDFFALYIIRSGRGVHQIDGTTYGLSRGDVYLLAPNSTHGYLNYRDLVIDAFYFPLSFLEPREVEALRAISGFWQLFVSGGETGIDRRLHLSPETHLAFESAIENLRAEYVRTDATSLWMLRSGFIRLMVNLARLHGDEPPRPLPLVKVNPRSEYHFGRAMELAEVRRWCEAQTTELPTPNQMASMMCLSPSQFRAVWKRQMGVAPAAYLRTLRVERARTLLKKGNLSVTQVARETGFTDVAHFSRAFRAVYGQAPSNYRRAR